MKPKTERKATIKLTERELYLLDNGFSTSYMPDPNDPDNVELSRITRKLKNALYSLERPK